MSKYRYNIFKDSLYVKTVLSYKEAKGYVKKQDKADRNRYDIYKVKLDNLKR